jgi:DNA-binding response OmpR family regulator
LKILIIEDSEKLGAAIRDAVTQANFVADWARCLGDAEQLRENGPYDLILLDLGLPDGDGLTFLRDLRDENVRTPVIVLTARGGLNDRIAGLDDGADDYLVKPFQLAEMVSRCRAVLRRRDRANLDSIRAGRLLVYEPTSGFVTVGGAKIGLSRREHQVLAELIRCFGKICSRSHLETTVYDSDTEVTSNAIEVSISRLRVYLLSIDADVEVRTVRGLGYVLNVATNA